MVDWKALVAAAVGIIITIYIILMGQVIAVDVQELYNTDSCLTECETIFRVRINRNHTTVLPPTKSLELRPDGPALPLRDSGIEILENVSYVATLRNSTCNPYNVTMPGNITNGTLPYNISIANCTSTSYQVTRYRGEWQPWSAPGFRWVDGEWYYFRVWGKKQLTMYPNNVEVSVYMLEQKLPLTWWDADYGYRYQILSNATISKLPISVNDTDLVNATAYWTNNATSIENVSVYCENSGCGTGAIAMANDTDEKFWEREDLGTGNSPTSVWSSQVNASNIHHFSTSLFDSSGNSNPIAVHTGNPTFNASGKFMQAMDFTSDSLTFNFTLGTNPAAEWTAEAWIYIQEPAAEGYPLTIAMYDGGWHGWFIAHESADMQVRCFDREHADPVVSDDALVIGRWYHVACVKNVTHWYMYVNGTLQSDVSINSNALIWHTNNPIIGAGRDGDAKFFGGLIDEVRLWERELSATEISDNYNSGINNLTALGPEEEAPPVDTCTPGTNWAMDCSDNCTKTGETITTGNWSVYGSGGFFLCDGCTLNVESFAMNATACKILFNGTFKYVVG